MAAGAAHGGDGTLSTLRHHRALLSALAGAALLTALSAGRAGRFWPLAAATGLAAIAWLSWCARERAAQQVWIGVAALVAAYAISLVAAVQPLDAWAALYGAAALLVAETAYWAAGDPEPGSGEAAVARRLRAGTAVAALAGLGVGGLQLAAAASGGSAGPEATALGVAAAAAALAVLALAARRAPGTPST